MNPAELLDAIERVRKDLSITQTRVIEIGRAVEHLCASADIPTAPPLLHCEHCPGTYRTARSLAEHQYRRHDGPLPEHVIAAERKAA